VDPSIIGFLISITVGVLLLLFTFSNWANRNIDDLFLTLFGVVGIIITILSFFVPSVIYEVTTRVKVSEMAEDICQERGYDTFESWEGYGIFPDYPAVLKCKYYDNNIVGNFKIEEK